MIIRVGSRLRTFACRYGRLYPEVHQAIHKIVESQLSLLTTTFDPKTQIVNLSAI